MKYFGRLLRKMRGNTPLSDIAATAKLDRAYLVHVEDGRIAVDELTVRLILKKSFGLNRREIARVLIGLRLYELGLRDNELRLLVIDLITKTTPAITREKIRSLYRSYAER